MAIFNSYVSLPEGSSFWYQTTSNHPFWFFGGWVFDPHPHLETPFCTPFAAQLSSAMAHNSWSITRCGSFDAALRSVSGQIWSIRQVEGRDQWWTSIKPSSSLKVPRVWGFCKGSTTTQPPFQGCLAQQIWRNSCGPLLAIFCDESPHMSGWIITLRWDYHRLYVFLGKI